MLKHGMFEDSRNLVLDSTPNCVIRGKNSSDARPTWIDLAEAQIAPMWTSSLASAESLTVFRSILVVAGEMPRMALCLAPLITAPNTLSISWAMVGNWSASAVSKDSYKNGIVSCLAIQTCNTDTATSLNQSS